VILEQHWNRVFAKDDLLDVYADKKKSAQVGGDIIANKKLSY